MKKKLIIIGAGGAAVSVCNVAISAGFDVQYFVDSDKAGQKLLGIEIIKNIDDFKNGNIKGDDIFFAIAVGANFARERIFNEICNDSILNLPIEKFPPLVHKSAVISFACELGFGSIAMPNSTVGPNSRIGKFCLVNTNASIDHDSILDDYSSLAPGSNTGGYVNIGKRSAISIGAKIKHHIKIGDDTVIGANSYVNEDISSNKIAYGSPAKIIKTRLIDDKYL